MTLEPYYFEPNVLQTLKMIALKMVKCIIDRGNYFLLRDANSVQVLLISANFELDELN